GSSAAIRATSSKVITHAPYVKRIADGKVMAIQPSFQSGRTSRCGSQRADLDRGAVGADLLPAAADLGSVEAHRQDGISVTHHGLVHQPLLGLHPAVYQHLCLAAQLAAHERLEPRADLRAEVPGAHGQSEDLADHV